LPLPAERGRVNRETMEEAMTRKVTLWHVTPACNAESILEGGIDPIFSTTGRSVIYLCVLSRVPWARLRCAQRHGADPSRMAVFAVEVRKGLLTRFRHGLYFCPQKQRSLKLFWHD